MKFCLYNVTTTLKIGGIETFYWEVAKELQKRGAEVEIVSGKGEYVKYNDIPIKMFDFIKRDKVFNFGNRFRKWGERVSFFKNSYNYLKKNGYDFFLIHKPFDFFVAFFIKRVFPKTRFIFVSGGEDFYGFDIFFSKYIDFFLAVSKENKKIIENRYKRDVKILHNGVDTDVFKPLPQAREKLRKRYNLTDKKVLLSVGRVVGWKGFDLVIDAIKDTKYIYIIIGDGEHLEKLKQKAKVNNLENQIIFLGQINNKELPNYLNMADIFVQPSIGHEAFGITLIEAMACGLPVVASYNGGMKDIIDSKSGLFFETNKIYDLKEKIDKIWHLDLNPRDRVVKNFTWQKTIDKLLGETV